MQQSAVSACMQLQCYEIMQLGSSLQGVSRLVPVTTANSYTRHAGQYSLLTKHPGQECSHGIHNILLSCPVHILANYAQLSSPSPEILLCQIIFDLYCCTIL